MAERITWLINVVLSVVVSYDFDDPNVLQFCITVTRYWNWGRREIAREEHVITLPNLPRLAWCTAHRLAALFRKEIADEVNGKDEFGARAWFDPVVGTTGVLGWSYNVMTSEKWSTKELNDIGVDTGDWL